MSLSIIQQKPSVGWNCVCEEKCCSQSCMFTQTYKHYVSAFLCPNHGKAKTSVSNMVEEHLIYRTILLIRMLAMWTKWLNVMQSIVKHTFLHPSNNKNNAQSLLFVLLLPPPHLSFVLLFLLRLPPSPPPLCFGSIGHCISFPWVVLMSRLACLNGMKFALPYSLKGFAFLAKTSFKISTPLTYGLIPFQIY